MEIFNQLYERSGKGIIYNLLWSVKTQAPVSGGEENFSLCDSVSDQHPFQYPYLLRVFLYFYQH